MGMNNITNITNSTGCNPLLNNPPADPTGLSFPPPIPPMMNPLPPTFCAPPPPIFYGNKNKDSFNHSKVRSGQNPHKKEEKEHSSFGKALLAFAAIGALKGALSTMALQFVSKKRPELFKAARENIDKINKQVKGKWAKRYFKVVLNEFDVAKKGNKAIFKHTLKSGLVFGAFAAGCFVVFKGLKMGYEKLKN